MCIRDRIDAASNTGVDNVRELRENVRYAPARGPYKVYIIDEVHMLSTAAFNALLKLHAPVHAVALGGTRFGEAELESSGGMRVVTRIGVGFDAVDIPALNKCSVPLMTTGIANSPSVAEQALYFMLAFAKRYQAKYKQPPDFYAGFAYDAVHLMANAQAAVDDPNDKEAVRKALEGTKDWAGAQGVFKNHPINRAWLDINAGRTHVANNVGKFGRNWGASMFGAENEDFFL